MSHGKANHCASAQVPVRERSPRQTRTRESIFMARQGWNIIGALTAPTPRLFEKPTT